MSIMSIDDKTKSVIQQLTDGTAFDRTFETTIGTVTAPLNAATAALTSVPATINGVASNLISNVTGLGSAVTSTANQIPSFLSHVQSHFDNLPKNMHLFSSSQGLANALVPPTGGNNCTSMHDFFGSITSEGPSLIGDIKQKALDVVGHISDFNSLGTSLQTQITSTRSALISNIQSEIAAATNQTLITQLQTSLSQIQSTFATGVADVRSGLIDGLRSQLSSARWQAVNGVADAMRSVDLNILGKSNIISGIASQLTQHGTGLQSLISSEQAKLTDAVSKLITLGEASAMKSLFSSDPCVQTLLGYVGSSSLLSNLGG